jgi:peptidyl-tRNA hydrolase, PTH2 family
METSTMIKQVIVVRKDLNMRKGKMCSQVAHASMKVFFDRIKLPKEGQSYSFYTIDFTLEMKEWMNSSFTKIVVSCNSEQELHNLKKQADRSNIVNAIILDNGNTEFKDVCPKCNGRGMFNYDLSYIDEKPYYSLEKCLTCNGTGKVNKPTYTCLAIGPDEAEKIDKITKDLDLL